jgi:hypothetical protein
MPDRHAPAAPFTARSAYTRGEISREAAARPPVRFSYGPGTDLASYRPPAGTRLARPGVVVQRGGAPGPSVVHPGRRDPSRRDRRRRRGQGTGRGNRLRPRRGGHRSRRRHVRGALVDRGWPGLLRGRLVLPDPGGRPGHQYGRPGTAGTIGHHRPSLVDPQRAAGGHRRDPPGRTARSCRQPAQRGHP